MAIVGTINNFEKCIPSRDRPVLFSPLLPRGMDEIQSTAALIIYVMGLDSKRISSLA